MAIIPEIADKLGQFVNNFFTFMKSNIETLYPGLKPKEQEKQAFLQTTNIHTTCVMRSGLNMCGTASAHQNMIQACLFKFDLTLTKDNFSISDPVNMGKLNNTNWHRLNAAEIEYVENDLIVPWTTAEHYSVNKLQDGVLSARVSISSNNRITLGVYDGDNIYHADWVNQSFLTTWGTTWASAGYLDIAYNVLEYTVSDGYVNVTFSESGWSINNLYPNSRTLFGLKSYPFVGNFKDQTFINNYITNNGATNNYHRTYTTADNKNIEVYYGDNYIIYYTQDDEPVSYDDVKYVFDFAIDQINDDNGTAIPKAPSFIPPVEDPDADIEVEMDLNDAAFGTGLSHYYVTTVDAPVLSDISAAMSSWDINDTGKDLYRNLLSCRITKVGPIPAENSTFVIYGEELLYNGSPITINKITGNPSMDLGEYEILPKFNDFRDYAPYTKIEMFIPYIGWVALPSHVMSSEEAPKIITGTLLCDIIAGTCKAVIKCNDTVVAEASGFTAVDVPFTGENVGMKMAGIASAITSYGNTASKTVGNIASGGMSGGAGAGAAAAGGLVGLLGSYAQMYSAFNANYTEICGKTGDGCNVAGLNKVYIKIQRPKTGGYAEPDFVPEDYGHTTGFIAMKKAQISECEGLIVCSNPDTSGIGGATDRERQMIKNLLESGIIVRHTEPEP